MTASGRLAAARRGAQAALLCARFTSHRDPPTTPRAVAALAGVLGPTAGGEPGLSACRGGAFIACHRSVAQHTCGLPSTQPNHQADHPRLASKCAAQLDVPRPGPRTAVVRPAVWYRRPGSATSGGAPPVLRLGASVRPDTPGASPAGAVPRGGRPPCHARVHAARAHSPAPRAPRSAWRRGASPGDRAAPIAQARR